jgi:hypothetical protein
MRELIEAAELCVGTVGGGITLAHTELMKSMAEGELKVLQEHIANFGVLIEYLKAGDRYVQLEDTGASRAAKTASEAYCWRARSQNR